MVLLPIEVSYIVFALFKHKSRSVRLHITPKAELKFFIDLNFGTGDFSYLKYLVKFGGWVSWSSVASQHRNCKKLYNRKSKKQNIFNKFKGALMQI